MKESGPQLTTLNPNVSIYEKSLYTLLQFGSSVAIKMNTIGLNLDEVATHLNSFLSNAKPEASEADSSQPRLAHLTQNYMVEILQKVVKAEAVSAACEDFNQPGAEDCGLRSKLMKNYQAQLFTFQMQNVVNYQVNLNKVRALESTFDGIYTHSSPDARQSDSRTSDYGEEQMLDDGLFVAQPGKPVAHSEKPGSFYDVFSLPLKELMRPEVVYLLIKHAFGSFQRYVASL